MGEIIKFPCETFFLEKVNIEDATDCPIVKLEARVRNLALDEGDRIAEEYEWDSYMIYDSKHKLVVRFVEPQERA